MVDQRAEKLENPEGAKSVMDKFMDMMNEGSSDDDEEKAELDLIRVSILCLRVQNLDDARITCEFSSCISGIERGRKFGVEPTRPVLTEIIDTVLKKWTVPE